MQKIVNNNPRYQGVGNGESYAKRVIKLLREFKINTLLAKSIVFFYQRYFFKYIYRNVQFLNHKFFVSQKEFSFQGIIYRYFIDKYNNTWSNERKVEVAIVNEYLRKFQDGIVLEVGNVTSHYSEVHYDIVDKFEVCKNVINEDILTYNPSIKYDLIISISTLEHVGWDDSEQDPNKIARVLEKIKSLKKERGLALITAPLGYNPNLDYMLANDLLPFNEIYCLKRISKKGEWVEVPFDKKEVFTYGSPYPCANAIFVGFI